MSSIHTPAINPDDLLSQDPQYIYYVKALIAAKQAYSKSKTNANREAVKMLRYNASMENINIYDLEHDVWTVMYGRQPNQAEKDSIAPLVHEVYLMKEMQDIRALYARTADSDMRKQLHNEAQFIRMQVYGMGLDAYAFESRAFLIYEGEPMSAELQKGQYAHVADAIKMWNTQVTTPEAKKDLQTPHYDEWESYKKRINATKLDLSNRYSETYSGADMVVFMAFPGHKPLEIGVASTVSYTTYREKKQVRTLGRVSAKGITKGPRTISGRLIFTIIREHVVEMLRKEIPYLRNLKTILMDELPPFDILVSFGNEYGGSAGLVIQGITTVDEQKTMSIEDLFTENLFTFLARALEPMRDMNNLDREYDPLEWFTSSFNAPGSEAVANFKPKELQLYKDAELLTDPSPFYGSIAGWDAATYDWSKLAENLGIDGSLVEAYTPNQTAGLDPVDGVDGPPVMADEAGTHDNVLFVQVATPYQNKWKLLGAGTIWVTQDGKKIGEAKLTKYNTDDLYKAGYFTTAPQSSNMSTQQFPMRMIKGTEATMNERNIEGVLIKKINYTKGKEITVTFLPEGTDYNSKTVLHKVADDQTYVIVKTEQKVSGNPNPGAPGASTTTIGLFTVEKVNDGKNAYAYWEQNKPKKSRNGGGTISADLKKSVAVSKEMGESITVQAVTEAGEVLRSAPFKIFWTLDLSRCDKTDDWWDPFDNSNFKKYDAIDKTAGMVSSTAMKAMNDGDGSWTGKTHSTNLLSTIPIPKGDFYTVSKKDKSGKRKKLYWKDLPKLAVVHWVISVYPPNVNIDKHAFSSKDAYIQVSYVKDA